MLDGSWDDDLDALVLKVPHPPEVTGISDAFTGQPGVAPTTWIAIYGKNLASSTRTWDGAIQGVQLPTALDGVGRKTANVVLGNAFGIEAGIVVDTHVARLSKRLRLSAHTQPEKIEQDLIGWVPRSDWTLFSHWLIWHGRRRCGARSPDCAHCELRGFCPSAAG